MKTKRNKLLIYSLVVAVIFAFITCQEDGDPTIIYGELCFEIDNNNALKSTISENCDLDNVDGIILTILKDNGDETEYVSSEVKLFKMNDSYFSQKINLEAGSYMLTEFLLVDSNNNAIYISPIEGSLQAQNVNKPLPLAFKVFKDSVSQVAVEVLSTQGYTPEDFGYASFIINEIKIFSFLINVSEIGTDSLLAAELAISSGDYIYKQVLDPGAPNKVTIKDKLSIYTVTVTKPGYKTFAENFTCAELKEYKNVPLVIELEPLDISINEGLVVYYSFNGNANDNNGSGYDGVVCGACLTKDRNNNSNSAYYFDGVNDYIEVVNFGSIAPENEITISLWARTEVSKAQFAMLLCPENSGTEIQNTLDVCINYYHDGGNWIFWDFGWRGEGGNVPGRLYIRDADFDADWHHYVLISSISESIMKIYKDGIMLNMENDPKYLFDSGEKYLRIGSGENQRYFKGAIDEIYVYNRVLSEPEIQVLLNN
jgi:hypothetical protein